MSAAPATEAPPNCLNCGTPLAHPRPRYCGRCGQETNVRPPKLFEFVQQFGGAYFSTEGAFWRTLALLLFKPGELTRQYRAGRRKHYVLPLRLYITISLFALLAVRLVGPDFQFQTDKGKGLNVAEFKDFTVLEIGNGSRAGLDKDGKFYCQKLPAWLCKQLEIRLDLDPKSVARELQKLPARFIGHFGTAMFLLMPLFALQHQLVYLRRGLRYSEHLVYALHVHSFWFFAIGLALLPWEWVPITLAVVVPLYTLVAARRVYGGGWFGTLWRAALVFLMYSIVIGIAMGLVFIWAFFS